MDFIDLEFVAVSTLEEATELVKDVDEFDMPFLALSLELKSPLWTGDKKLIKGLSEKNIDWLLDTKMMMEIREEM